MYYLLMMNIINRIRIIRIPLLFIIFTLPTYNWQKSYQTVYDLNLNRDKIFGMYKTFHGNKDARGIGLFITKNQIEAMGGKVYVESEVGKGTTFKIHFKRG